MDTDRAILRSESGWESCCRRFGLTSEQRKKIRAEWEKLTKLFRDVQHRRQLYRQLDTLLEFVLALPSRALSPSLLRICSC